MKLRRYRNRDGSTEVVVEGRNARMRALIGADIVPARRFHARVAPCNTPSATDTVPPPDPPPPAPSPPPCRLLPSDAFVRLLASLPTLAESPLVFAARPDGSVA